jgi:glycosyltransferase involved in cell wall biosynthesis
VKTVDGPEGIYGKAMALLKPFLTALLRALQYSSNRNLHSLALIPSGLVTKINKADVDIVQLNWICNEFLSVEDIGRIKKPIVWRLSDMWPFCGAEHYTDDGPNARWRFGYNKNNRPSNHKCLDIDRMVWNRKRLSWKKPMHIVAPSNWMANCVRNSELMRNWPVSVIPATVDIHQFKPCDKLFSRKVLGLPATCKLILFGAVGGIKNRTKGSDLLQKAVIHGVSHDLFGDAEGLIFGQYAPLKPPNFGIPLHWLGYVSNDAKLALIYSAADITVVPSRQDNLPQTAIEAQACGCPVVGFKTSGMPDAVLDRETGYLAKAYDILDLAFGINWVLSDKARHSTLSSAAREHAMRRWSPEIVVKQYLAVYEQVLAGSGE